MKQSRLPIAVANSCRLHKRSAFTLLELLFAIAIISVLFVLSLVGLRAGRELTNNSKCVSNLRRLGQAVFNYANDNNGNLLPCLLQNSHETWTPGDLSLPWSRILVGMTGANTPNYLAPDLYPPSDATKATGNTIFDCPSRKGMPGYKAAFYDKLHYGYSYWPGFDNRAVTIIYPGEVVDVKTPMRKLSAIERPSKTMLFGEIEPSYVLYPERPDWCVLPHRDAMNAYYADGSVRRITKEILGRATGESPKPPF